MEKYGIYVHIPFCKARCGYCAFSSCCDYSLQQPYFDKLFKEADARANKDVAVSTVFLGGGTPSSVDTEYLDELFSKLAERFNLPAAEEITVECNPESVTENLLACLKRNGVNRLSFGLQSTNDATLKRIGRIHKYRDFLAALNLAEQYGFENINVDLILGLPEDFDDFKQSVNNAAQLPVKHVSVYALELHGNSPIYNLCKKRYNFDDDTLADMYDYAVNVLSAHGFNRYEISNFARGGYKCKHNINYWDEGRYIALGAAASGFIGDVRYTNPFDVKDYISAPMQDLLGGGDRLTLNEQANEYVMLRLRLTDGVDIAEFKHRYNAGFTEYFSGAQKLINDGLLAVHNNAVFVPADKFYVINSILTELLNF